MQRFYLGLWFVLAGWCAHALFGQEWLGYVVMSSGLLMVAAGLAALGQLDPHANGRIEHEPSDARAAPGSGSRAAAGAVFRQRL